jgi:hypothetical protein
LGQSAWSGHDYENYNFSDATIFEENDSTSNTVSTNEIYTEINNGTLVILGVYDPDNCLVYCIPSLIGDDTSYMYFTSSLKDYNGNPITLILEMDINEYSSCSGYYLVNSGGSGLPSVTSSDNGKILKVVNGAWAAATLNTYNGGVS